MSIINTCLNTIAAEAFSIVADRIEAGESPTAMAQDLLKKHSKVIFNGNGYDPEWPEQAVEKGIWRIDSASTPLRSSPTRRTPSCSRRWACSPPASARRAKPCCSSTTPATVEMEALTMVDMINQHVIPSCKKAELGFVKKLEDSVKTLKKGVSKGSTAPPDEAEAAASPASSAWTP